MPEEPSFADLIGRLRDGDGEAADIVFRRFARRLIGLARGRLDARLLQKVGPEDVVQSVFRSFFVRHAAGQFDLESWDSLWSLLTVITLRKCGHQMEHFRAACRDVAREHPPPSPQGSVSSWEAIAREPTPEEAVLLTDTVEQLMAGLDGEHRQIAELALAGHTVPEISLQARLSERTVFRRLERIKARLRRLMV
jgi:DNA-directed RNA polymerase specialized sigma24 family protein